MDLTWMDLPIHLMALRKVICLPRPPNSMDLIMDHLLPTSTGRHITAKDTTVPQVPHPTSNKNALASQAMSLTDPTTEGHPTSMDPLLMAQDHEDLAKPSISSNS
jgi:hypothetical protein